MAKTTRVRNAINTLQKEKQKLLELEIKRGAEPLLLTVHLQQGDSITSLPHVHKLVVDKEEEVGV